MLIMILTFVVEIGFVMYDFSTINYAASSLAIEVAREGEFTDEIAFRIADYLANWTSCGSETDLIRSNTPYVDQERIILWGPPPGDKFQRGQMISVGVSYPIKFKIFYMDALAHWVIDDHKLILKSRASAPSEVYLEGGW